jgi:hypothetical protein
MTLEKQNCMQQKIKRTLNSGTAYYNLVQNLLSAHCCLRIYIFKYTELYSYLLFHESKTVLILGQGCRLRMFENVVLRKIYEPKRDEVTVEWRQLQNKELHEMYSSSNTIQNTCGACGTHGKEYKCIYSFAGEI